VATREREVFVPHDVALDLGATGKAFAADLVARSITERTGAGCVISLGGDVAVGHPGGDATAEPQFWPVTIAETPDEPPAAVVTLASGGLATSTTMARRWVRGGHVVHHLLDPATGRPVTRSWRTASVTATTCLAANTASTAAILLGTRAPEWLERFGVGARLVGVDGEVRFVGSWVEEEV
jgi:thiamine biosynthesis lipoprotein